MSRKVPVFLEPDKSRRITVFGGGNVAFRKCKQFEGFHVTVIADEVVPGMDSVCDEILLRHFDPSNISEYLTDTFIAIAATDSKALNHEITESARKLGILINSAHGGGNLLLPSTVRKKNYTVAVSSEGTVPAFPPYVAKHIDAMLGPEFDTMLELLTDLRKDLPEHVTMQPKRAEYLAEILADSEIWTLLKSGKYTAAKDRAISTRKKYETQ